MKLYISKSKIYFIICIIITMILMANYNVDSSAKYEAKLVELIAPVMRISNSVSSFCNRMYNKIEIFFSIYEEHERLKTRNDFLEQYYYLSKQLEAENNQLKLELSFTKNFSYKYVTAQVIGRTNNSSNQHLIIDSGSKQNLKKGQIVIAEGQLVGRITQVMKNTARVLLLTDPLSRIPVTSLESKTKFIIAGASTNYFSCKYLDEKHFLKEGELVVTSNDIAEIIPNIMVGSVFKEDNIYYIKPNINFNKIEFVQILQPNETS